MADDNGYMEGNEIYGAIKFGEFSKYLRNKRVKTQFQHQQRKADDLAITGEEAKPQIFKDVRIHINGQTYVPYQTLVDTVVAYGGESHPVLDRKSLVTHIIASNLTPKKFKEFSEYKVVTEAWIIESIQAGRLLDWAKYRLQAEGYSLATQADRLVDGQAPGGSTSKQTNLLNLRNQQEPVASTSKVKPKAVKSTQVESKVDPTRPTTPKKGPITTDSTIERSPYLPDRISHRAGDLLKDEEWRMKNTAIAPDFIEGYYKSSRLHRLSNWKANLQFLVARLITELIDEGAILKDNALLAKPIGEFKGTPADKRVIAHVDFDAFFVGVGYKARPDLIGQPVAVCHSKGADGEGSTSEIASCSYEARDFGVRAGMSLGKARQLCPHIQTMPYDFELYSSISEQFYKLLLAHADHLQAVSVDEAYIDVTSKTSLDQRHDKPMPLVYAEELRTKIRDITGVDASVGISYNMVLARLATKKAKPAGSFFLAPGTTSDQEIRAFLLPLDVQELPGIGWSMANKLKEELSVETLGDAIRVGPSRLKNCIGPKNGQKVVDFAYGIDPRPLEPPAPRQSVSVELNYAIRMKSDEEVETFFNRLCLHLAERMKEIKVTARKITLKVMQKAADVTEETTYKFMGHGKVDNFNATDNLPSATNDGALIAQVALKLLKTMHIPCEDLRGIGIQMTKLEGFGAQDLTVDRGQRKLDFAKAAPKTEIAKEKEKAPLVKTSSDIVLLDVPPPAQQPKKRSRSPSSSPVVQKTAAKKRQPSVQQESKPVAPKLDNNAKQPMLALPTTKKGLKKGKGKAEPSIQTTIGFTGQLKWQPATSKLLQRGKVTDADLIEHDIDPSYYRSLPPAYQSDCLTMAMEQKREQNLVLARERLKYQRFQASSSLAEIPTQDLFDAPIPAEPAFGKLLAIEDIRRRIDKWVERDADDGPEPVDRDKLGSYLLACATDGPRGANLEKVTAVLQWWKWAVQKRAGMGKEDWLVAWAHVKGQVDEAVGCTLCV